MWKQLIVYSWLVIFSVLVMYGNFSGHYTMRPASLPFTLLVNWIIYGGFILLMFSSLYILFWPKD